MNPAPPVTRTLMGRRCCAIGAFLSTVLGPDRSICGARRGEVKRTKEVPAMRLDGSCQCGKVRFRVQSETPYPYMYCYCSICRKTTGGAFGCNLMGQRDTLRVAGRAHLACYHAIIRNPRKRSVRSSGERWFCRRCGTHLYVLDDHWP